LLHPGSGFAVNRAAQSSGRICPAAPPDDDLEWRLPHRDRPDPREHLPLRQIAVANYLAAALAIDLIGTGGDPLLRFDLHRLREQLLGAGTQHFRQHIAAHGAWKLQRFRHTVTHGGVLLKKKKK
jgi:hypothetical protein